MLPDLSADVSMVAAKPDLLHMPIPAYGADPHHRRIGFAAFINGNRVKAVADMRPQGMVMKIMLRLRPAPDNWHT